MRNPPVIGPSDGDRENVGGPGNELPSVTGLRGVRSFAGSVIKRASEESGSGGVSWVSNSIETVDIPLR